MKAKKRIRILRVLAIALSTTAYAALRIQRMQRRLLGSSSRPLVS